ncbi:unnamed protein product [Gordionus sp. m RMFG-2023]|uniref:uncharacterized protein DDB_G0283357-like n=1 Tax=Gordionus sp. m RMFG-2023 TaxID=3053472 RepID=UPI0030E572B6
MSEFHESIRRIFEDVEIFLILHVKPLLDDLSYDGKLQRQHILSCIRALKAEYPAINNMGACPEFMTGENSDKTEESLPRNKSSNNLNNTDTGFSSNSNRSDYSITSKYDKKAKRFFRKKKNEETKVQQLTNAQGENDQSVAIKSIMQGLEKDTNSLVSSNKTSTKHSKKMDKIQNRSNFATFFNLTSFTSASASSTNKKKRFFFSSSSKSSSNLATALNSCSNDNLLNLEYKSDGKNSRNHDNFKNEFSIGESSLNYSEGNDLSDNCKKGVMVECALNKDGHVGTSNFKRHYLKKSIGTDLGKSFNPKALSSKIEIDTINQAGSTFNDKMFGPASSDHFYRNRSASIQNFMVPPSDETSFQSKKREEARYNCDNSDQSILSTERNLTNREATTGFNSIFNADEVNDKDDTKMGANEGTKVMTNEELDMPLEKEVIASEKVPKIVETLKDGQPNAIILSEPLNFDNILDQYFSSIIDVGCDYIPEESDTDSRNTHENNKNIDYNKNVENGSAKREPNRISDREENMSRKGENNSSNSPSKSFKNNLFSMPLNKDIDKTKFSYVYENESDDTPNDKTEKRDDSNAKDDRISNESTNIEFVTSSSQMSLRPSRLSSSMTHLHNPIPSIPSQPPSIPQFTKTSKIARNTTHHHHSLNPNQSNHVHNNTGSTNRFAFRMNHNNRRGFYASAHAVYQPPSDNAREEGLISTEGGDCGWAQKSRFSKQHIPSYQHSQRHNLSEYEEISREDFQNPVEWVHTNEKEETYNGQWKKINKERYRNMDASNSMQRSSYVGYDNRKKNEIDSGSIGPWIDPPYMIGSLAKSWQNSICTIGGAKKGHQYLINSTVRSTKFRPMPANFRRGHVRECHDFNADSCCDDSILPHKDKIRAHPAQCVGRRYENYYDDNDINPDEMMIGDFGEHAREVEEENEDFYENDYNVESSVPVKEIKDKYNVNKGSKGNGNYVYEDKLRPDRGEPVYITSKKYDRLGWWMGVSLKTGERGLVPKTRLVPTRHSSCFDGKYGAHLEAIELRDGREISKNYYYIYYP